MLWEPLTCGNESALCEAVTFMLKLRGRWVAGVAWQREACCRLQRSIRAGSGGGKPNSKCTELGAGRGEGL